MNWTHNWTGITHEWHHHEVHRRSPWVDQNRNMTPGRGDIRSAYLLYESTLAPQCILRLHRKSLDFLKFHQVRSNSQWNVLYFTLIGKICIDICNKLFSSTRCICFGLNVCKFAQPVGILSGIGGKRSFERLKTY